MYGDEIDFRNEKGEILKTNKLLKKGTISDIFEGAKVTGYSKELINNMRLYKVELSKDKKNIEGPFYISQGELNSLLGNSSGF